MRYIALLALITFFGCSDQKRLDELEAENSKLQSQLEIITEETHQKDGYIEDYTQTVNEVYDYLDRIRKREGLLMRFSREMEQDKNAELKDKIMMNLSSIDQYIKNSRAEIKRLQKKMSEGQYKFASLEKSIDTLTSIIDKKEREILALRTEIADLNDQLTQKENRLAEQSEILNAKTDKLNTAYFIIGDDRELREKEIITKRGGILGIGRTTLLSENMDPSYFTETDITRTDSINIPVQAKSVKIISPHHPDSYHIVASNEDASTLEIIDPDEFWKMKYLVIVAKK